MNFMGFKIHPLTLISVGVFVAGAMLIAIGATQPVCWGLTMPGQLLPSDYYMAGVTIMVVSAIGATLPGLHRLVLVENRKEE